MCLPVFEQSAECTLRVPRCVWNSGGCWQTLHFRLWSGRNYHKSSFHLPAHHHHGQLSLVCLFSGVANFLLLLVPFSFPSFLLPSFPSLPSPPHLIPLEILSTCLCPCLSSSLAHLLVSPARQPSLRPSLSSFLFSFHSLSPSVHFLPSFLPFAFLSISLSPILRPLFLRPFFPSWTIYQSSTWVVDDVHFSS